MRNRLIAIALVIILALSLLPPINAFADTGTAVSLSLSNNATGSLKEGDQVTVTLNVGSNTGVNGLQIFLTYDSSVFSYVSKQTGSAIQNDVLNGDLSVTYNVASAGNFIMLVTKGDGTAFSNTGTYVTFVLQVKTGVTAGSKPIGFSTAIPDNTAYSLGGATYDVASLTGTSVTVDIPATGISLTAAGGATSIAGIGGTLQMTAAVLPPNAVQPASQSDYTWLSSNPSAATVNANGLVTAIGAGTTNITASYGAFTSNGYSITVSLSDLSGTLGITGDAKVGETLTASLSGAGAPSSGVIYKWYVGGSETSSHTGSTYAIVPGDVGKTIVCKATHADYSGFVASSATAAVIAAEQNAPGAPTLNLKTNSSIEIAAPALPAGAPEGAALEFGYTKTAGAGNVASWGPSLAFTGLDANTTYYIYARCKEITGYKPSAASSALEVTTDKTAHALSVSCDPAAGGTASASKSTAAVGDEITIAAVPGADYYFDRWEDTAASDKVAFANASAPSTTFTMPDRDVAIKAYFLEKIGTVIAGASNQTYTYDGNYKPYNIAGVTIREDNVGAAEVSGPGVYLQISYYNGYTGGAPTTSFIDGPKDAGDYTVALGFLGDTTHKAAVTLYMKLTINKASQAAPVAPVASDITANGFTYTPVVGQAYAITASATAPTAGDVLWGNAAASADPVTITTLSPGTIYYLHTYLPEKANYEASAAATSGAINTLDTFSFDVTPSAVYFFSRTGAAAVDSAETITITTQGTGVYTDIGAVLSGTDASAFTFGTLAATAGANDTLTFTIEPKTDTVLSAEKTYHATLTISYKEAGAGAFASAKQVVLNVTYEVKNKIDVTINPVGTASDGKYTYSASPVAPYTTIGAATYTPVSGVGAFNEVYNYLYTSTGATPAYSSGTAPVNVGTYQLVISVPDANPDYMGSKTIPFEITKKGLTVTGLTAASKVYDGTTAATISGGTLNGVAAADAGGVSVAMPVSGTFADHDAETDKVVTFAALVLSGSRAGNYTLTQPGSLTADISAKPVTATVSIADKTYDATTAATANVTVSADQICSGDVLAVTGVTAAFNSADAGSNKAVTVIVSAAGWGNANYQVTIPTSATGNILKRALNIIFSASYTHTYDGLAKSVEATVAAADATTGLVGGDTAAATVRTTYAKQLSADPVYGVPTASAPIPAGVYKLGAEVVIAGGNYLIGTLTDPALLTINKGTLALTPQNYPVAFVNTVEQNKALSGLALTPNVAGTYTVDSYSDPNGILAAAPAVSGGNLKFMIATGLSDAMVGKTATVTIKFTPSTADTYNEQTVTVTITLADDTYTNTLVGTLPTQIKLGQEIDLTGIKLRTVFGSGIPAEELFVSDSAKVVIVNGYDKNATGAGALGLKTITFTALGNANRTYTHTVNVVDQLSGAALTITPPSKLTYDAYAAAALDLSGGAFSPVWMSGLPTGAGSALAVSMLTYPNGMTAAQMLSTIGTYTITVKYIFEGVTQTATFDVTVKLPASGIGTSPNGHNVGVQEKPNDPATPMTYTNAATSSPVSPSAVDITLNALTDAAARTVLDGLANAQAGFGSATRRAYFDLDFSTGSDEVIVGGGILTMTIPYPYGSNSGDMFAMVLRYPDGTSKAVVPGRTQYGLTFDAAGDVEIIIGWYTPSAPLPETESQTVFWENVRKAILNAPAGATITAYAGFYDQMPVSVMIAIKDRGVTLVINSAWGKLLKIDKTNALIPEYGRVYYPLSYLFDNLKDSTKTSTSGGSYGTVTVLLPPQTGDDTVVLYPYGMTDKNAGFLDGIWTGSTDETLVGDGITIMDSERVMDDSFYYGLLLIAAALLLAGAAWFTSGTKRRTKAN